MLGIYLNDHLAGATGGVELARRLAGEDHSEVMARLAEEIAEDRDALVEMMAALDIPVRQYKIWLGWTGEKVARLKPNGRVVSRSPLSHVIGLEMMRLGIEGKASGWRTLRARKDSRLDTNRLDRLIDRAHQQATQVEQLRERAAEEAFDVERNPE
jgi:hypothetical protein